MFSIQIIFIYQRLYNEISYICLIEHEGIVYKDGKSYADNYLVNATLCFKEEKWGIYENKHPENYENQPFFYARQTHIFLHLLIYCI